MGDRSNSHPLITLDRVSVHQLKFLPETESATRFHASILI